MTFTWDEATQRYRDSAGRFVARSRVRGAIESAIADAKADMRAVSNRLRSGSISADEWYSTMRGAIKDVELLSGAAARGGFDQMTASDYGRVGAAVKKQYAYLDRFAGEIEAGLKLGNGFVARAVSYGNAGRALYSAMVGDGMEAAGFDIERNVLGLGETGHCEGPGSCLEQSARGGVPIGELVPIGNRLCRGNCQCWIEYGRSDEAPPAPKTTAPSPQPAPTPAPTKPAADVETVLVVYVVYDTLALPGNRLGVITVPAVKGERKTATDARALALAKEEFPGWRARLIVVRG